MWIKSNQHKTVNKHKPNQTKPNQSSIWIDQYNILYNTNLIIILSYEQIQNQTQQTRKELNGHKSTRRKNESENLHHEYAFR
uniref:Uncharacterized protein n=1 Tax=Noccaea caerulescens TaxID=107243 RepID=A0A1J3JM14_NOCCA